MRDRELYRHILGIEKPWEVSEVELDVKGEKVDVWVEHPRGKSFECPKCGKECSVYDHVERTWRHLDTCQFRTMLHARVPRVNCEKHGILQVKVPWAEPGSQFTIFFERLAIELLLECSVKGAVKILGITWDEGYGIRKRAVRRGKERRGEEDIRHIGIDEKASKKGHNYLTLMVDLDRGRVLETALDRKKESLDLLFNKLTGEQKEKVEAVAMDMWKPYISSTLEHIPGAQEKIVFDRFHLMKHLTKAVDGVRKDEHRALKKEGESPLKGTKYLWLYNWENLPEQKLETFEELQRMNLKVGRAWAMKENLRELWDYSYPANARKFFKSWFWWATHSRLKPMIKAAYTFKNHIENILTYFKHRITNSVAEGINSKIQEIKKRACGFRNMANFQDAILFHCGGLDLYPTHSVS